MLSDTYARSGDEQTRTGSVIVVTISCLAAMLVIAGVLYAAGTGGRHQAALAAAACEPNLSPSGLQCTTTQTLVARYLAITNPASQQLTTDTAAYAAGERHHLGAARAALTAEVTSENALDTSLARFPFPPAAAPLGRKLIRDNQARARLTAEQARSTSLAQMRSFNHRVKVASATVQTDMELIRKALASRPAASQEP